MNDLYGSRCDCCGGELHDLADDTEDWDKIYDDIARQLINGEDLNTDAIYNRTAAQLIAAMNKGLGGTSFDDNDSRIALQKAFTHNIEQFSYAKTLTQFKLFKDAMFNDKGEIQSFATVKKAVFETGEIFNKNYLAAEHQFVTQSAIMAHKWETLDSEYLEFTTVGDSRVRPEHKLFDKFTALKTDPIWKRLYTPLSWGCRCTVIPGISKNISKEYDSDWANKVVDPLVKGTIFDNNVGITKKIFTDKHPYFKATGVKMTEPENSNLKTQRVVIRNWAKENIVGKTINHPDIEKPIHFTVTGIKEALNQPHKFIVEKNDAIKNIKRLIENSEFVKTDIDTKGRGFKYHYLKTTINKEDSFIVIREVGKETSFFSIVEKLKK